MTPDKMCKCKCRTVLRSLPLLEILEMLLGTQGVNNTLPQVLIPLLKYKG